MDLQKVIEAALVVAITNQHRNGAVYLDLEDLTCATIDGTIDLAAVAREVAQLFTVGVKTYAKCGEDGELKPPIYVFCQTPDSRA